tara:strand:- start:5382 stop:5732 length:351 start_codon:yes stop_codon:yes gene_type:complete
MLKKDALEFYFFIIFCQKSSPKLTRLGRGMAHIEEDTVPQVVDFSLDHEVVEISCGKHHCVARTAAGFIFVWGRNKGGQLGLGHTRDVLRPEQLYEHNKVGERSAVIAQCIGTGQR